MKNIYLFFLFLFLIGCSNNFVSNTNATAISCPSILFGSDHRVYIGSSNKDISIDNIEFQGEINNANFSKKCFLKNNIFASEISILIVMEPFIDELDNINMPFYIAILNQKKELQDMLYFSVSGQFKKNPETKKLIETEVIKRYDLQHGSINEKSIIVIGYMLENKRAEILN